MVARDSRDVQAKENRAPFRVRGCLAFAVLAAMALLALSRRSVLPPKLLIGWSSETTRICLSDRPRCSQASD